MHHGHSNFIGHDAEAMFDPEGSTRGQREYNRSSYSDCFRAQSETFEEISSPSNSTIDVYIKVFESNSG